MRLPKWLKILVLLISALLMFSALGPAASAYVLMFGFLTLMLFPGPDPNNPRLMRWVPWLWGVNAVAATVLVLAAMMGKSLLSPEVDSPTLSELSATILFCPLLGWTLVKRHRLFLPILIASSAVSLGLQVWDYSQSAIDLKTTLAFVGESLSEMMLAVYLYVKFKPAA